MELKCIKCGGEAHYIVVVGSGGSLCEKCFKEFTEGLSASIEKLLLARARGDKNEEMQSLY
jgi:hypothetical protein